MSIFPFINSDEQTNAETPIPMAREWAWDIEKGDFKLQNGKPYIVEGIDAVKIWVYKSLKTNRFKHSFYSWDYGSELNSLVGSGFTKGAAELEAKRMIEECLIDNPYIEGIDSLSVVFEDDTLSISYSLSTLYGSTEVVTNAY
ncbi:MULTISPECIES: DUF2634 domain-containing protein [Bacillaceae]|uniref:DUF2634 domain-containing protein n=1 Tax=Bacillaceae TaxID=186817 RepID=UPI000BFB553D|nr:MULTISPECIES: DUF2634 domain-containing protein [Bacillaceae]PGT89221.1 DNA-packaging protein [Bacillus sp. AFS040349]UGB31715.1 DUF2634 domain-containing protein [Metabacillus sp. B2-18]